MQRDQETAPRCGFNAQFLAAERSERIFAHHLRRLGIARVLDIGSNAGQFAAKLRRLGFAGVIYSVEPQAAAYAQLLANGRDDLNWFPLARQGAGALRQFTSLNLAENGWSSSLLEVHPNHLRAEHSTRCVGTERIFVNTASQLLRAELMRQIEALKIDVQGYEDQVIEGYLPFIDNVRLLLIELSVVECYHGGPDLFALDERLVKRHGFSRISLEPSYYDDVLGVVQQYDGIYFRPERPARTDSGGRGVRVGAVVTSIGAIPQRPQRDGTDIGAIWARTCQQSWWGLSDRVVSVAESPPPAEGIEWIRTVSRPTIAEMLRAMLPESGHVLLTNADIAFTSALVDLVPRLDPAGVYYGHRVEVEAGTAPGALKATGVYPLGFDYFLMPAAFIRTLTVDGLVPEEFRIGEPWWDYLLPVLSLARGFPLKKLPASSPIALHYAHATRYTPDLWLRNGALFLECAQRLLREPESHAVGLLAEIALESGDMQSRLERVATIICQGLP